VTLSINSDYHGRNQTFTAGPGDFLIDSNLSDDWIGADTVSSLKVLARSANPATPVPTWPVNAASFPAGASLSLVWEDGGGREYR
jgi:hypothetical protein